MESFYGNHSLAVTLSNTSGPYSSENRAPPVDIRVHAVLDVEWHPDEGNQEEIFPVLVCRHLSTHPFMGNASHVKKDDRIKFKPPESSNLVMLPMPHDPDFDPVAHIQRLDTSTTHVYLGAWRYEDKVKSPWWEGGQKMFSFREYMDWYMKKMEMRDLRDQMVWTGF
ncbi:uncharacterized protein ACA1_121430 [Acanthamoeba castellanii str. Neff]|uniref:Uncharacterized protein n=1 Tax=Acanthamoeba castellanii (strain ATCC 30010 / Neff) TaxID=1257118 RepID=L8GGV9_ACACF|nr:uncharacterized protein ACA1_121430 [Acanthamoeba castellanii str. Neff]ELR11436.1 hypothetical protein ACA1_121430 [Acanthamoeba castellanii str. Neff]